MTTSIYFLKMDEEELFDIFDNFTDIIISDKEETIENNPSILDFMEATVREMATGEEILLSNIDQALLDLLETFMNSFHIDVGKKTYRFVFQNLIAEGFYEKYKNLPQKAQA
jgi:hypothetical protein